MAVLTLGLFWLAASGTSIQTRLMSVGQSESRVLYCLVGGLIGAAMLHGAYRAMRRLPAVELLEDGIVVHDFPRTRRIPWPAIASIGQVEMVRSTGLDANAPVCSLTLSDGRAVRLHLDFRNAEPGEFADLLLRTWLHHRG